MKKFFRKFMRRDFVFLVCAISSILLRLFTTVLIDKLSVFIYPLAIIPLELVLLAAILVLAVMAIFAKSWRRFLVGLLLVCIVFLPLDSWRENLRFERLRPQMESVANQIAQEHASSLDGIIPNIKLPPEATHLSRGGGEVTLFVENNQAHIAFYKLRGTVDNAAEYIFNTQIEYKSSIYDYFEENTQRTRLAENWEYCVFN